MSNFQKISLLLLRLVMGWMFFYAGITKVINPGWSAGGYLKGAKNLVWFYGWLTTPAILPYINFINEWGLTLLGISLILGVAIRYSTVAGSLLMLLYYLVILDFPYPDKNSFLVDQHIIFILALTTLAAFKAGQVWGLEAWYNKLPIYHKYFDKK